MLSWKSKGKKEKPKRCMKGTCSHLHFKIFTNNCHILEKQRDRKRLTNVLCAHSLPRCPRTAEMQPGRCQEPGTEARSPTWVAGALSPAPAVARCLPECTLAGGWSRGQWWLNQTLWDGMWASQVASSLLCQTPSHASKPDEHDNGIGQCVIAETLSSS